MTDQATTPGSVEIGCRYCGVLDGFAHSGNCVLHPPQDQVERDPRMGELLERLAVFLGSRDERAADALERAWNQWVSRGAAWPS